MVNFEWDPAKAASNQKKHGVSFEEAQSVFYDEFAVQFFDEEESTGLGRPVFDAGDERRGSDFDRLPLRAGVRSYDSNHLCAKSDEV